jgi:uncharacterized protein (UPF0276 family)
MFLQTIKPEYIQQYHVAGGEYNAEYDIMIDTHGTDIQSQVMDLYCKTIDKIGNRPTLYERDNNIPEFDDLLNTVQNIRQSHKAHTGGVC